MHSPSKQKVINDDKEPGIGLPISALILQNKLFSNVGEDPSIVLFKLGRTEEEILNDLIGKLLIPTDALKLNLPV